ncbi:glycosyltransferase family 39 protein [Acaryochloris sp. IP29b_bin.148]|uniref:ArnT family glycosyltransferase n=1 Tax=Acaryochloris sp. IP29b_bin.148 TaxID=2969218 RepID=UPI00260CB4F9|nr:glycosyltransferase family 39 protein [Acaryochloris sp. IP29b_bin.148]
MTATKAWMSTINTKTMGLGFLIVISILFIGLRFVNIEADFPSNLTFSSALYTDEGWHLSAAINYFVTGDWYIEGDFNPAVNLPIGHFIQAMTFRIFGMSLASARSTVVVCFTLTVCFVFLLAAKYVDSVAAIFAIFFLSVNFFTFAYSRLAILEILMLALVLLAIWLASLSTQKLPFIVVSLSSILLVIATLTKTTAISALPALLYLSSQRGKTRQHKVLWAALSATIFIVILFSYNSIASQTYTDDFLYFKNLTLAERLSPSFLRIIKNFLLGIVQARRIEPFVYLFTVLSNLFLLLYSNFFRKNILVHISLLWMLAYFGVLSVTAYHPSRYFVPLIVPVSFLFGTAMSLSKCHLNKQASFFIQCLICSFILVSNGYKIINHISLPQFTFREMAEDVQQVMATQSSAKNTPILLGNLANSISLATGIQSVNTDLSIQPISWKIQTYNPQFYISLGHEPEVVDVLRQTYQLQKISEWDVFDNFYKNKAVYLFKLNHKDGVD